MTSFRRGAAVLDVAVVLAVEGVAGGGTVAMAACIVYSLILLKLRVMSRYQSG